MDHTAHLSTLGLILLAATVCIAQDAAPSHPPADLDPETAEIVDALILDLASFDSGTRGQAARGLKTLGPKAAGAVGALAVLLTDDVRENRWVAFDALAAIGPPAMGALTGALNSSNDRTRKMAVSHLRLLARRFELPAEQFLPLFVSAMQDRSAMVRSMAAAAVGDFKADGKGALEALAKLLDDQDQSVRHNALVSICRMGPAAEGAVDAVIRLLDDRDRFLRMHACVVLGKIGPPARAATLKLVEMYRTPSVNGREEILTALARIGPTDNPLAMGLLLDVMTNGDTTARWRVAWELGRMNAWDERSISALKAALRDRHQAVRIAAANALSKIHPDRTDGSDLPASADAVDALTRMLKDPETRVRWSAIWALGEARGAALSAVTDLLDVLENNQSPQLLRAAAVNALGKIGLADGRIVGALEKAAKDRDEKVRAVAKERLGDLQGSGPGEQVSAASR
ncbi:hypothetical protein LCGC14_0017220 [marine sediment metagenome]|uniref:TOG domain-containing protein n=1 Tax=marine sediment metagenome TaxID=412755 RepID=A0A0F9W4F7_9ZZZZ